MPIAFTGMPAKGRGVVQSLEPAGRYTDAGSIPQFPKAARGFSHSQLLTALSCGVPKACNRMHQHLRECEQSQTPAAISLLGHAKILHTLVGMASAALAAAVALNRYGDPNFLQAINGV